MLACDPVAQKYVFYLWWGANLDIGDIDLSSENVFHG
jgi:hypothetical protein